MISFSLAVDTTFSAFILFICLFVCFCLFVLGGNRLWNYVSLRVGLSHSPSTYYRLCSTNETDALSIILPTSSTISSNHFLKDTRGKGHLTLKMADFAQPVQI